MVMVRGGAVQCRFTSSPLVHAMAQPNPELVLADVGITFEEPKASIRERKLTAMKHLEVHMLLPVLVGCFLVVHHL